MAPNRCTGLIAEDEDVLRAELRSHLASLWPELDVVAEAANGIEALRALDRHAPQVAFLDIEMPGLTGLDVARQIQGRCHVVFVTAYDAHAIAAFEQGAIDYVLKPYEGARLALAVRRVQDRLRSTPLPLDGLLRELARVPSREYLRWINASQGQEVQLITVDEVCYFQSDTKYTRVVTASGPPLGFLVERRTDGHEVRRPCRLRELPAIDVKIPRKAVQEDDRPGHVRTLRARRRREHDGIESGRALHPEVGGDRRRRREE